MINLLALNFLAAGTPKRVLYITVYDYLVKDVKDKARLFNNL
jgi:hypothetical protein